MAALLQRSSTTYRIIQDHTNYPLVNKLYESMRSAALQGQLLATPFHPQCLIPIALMGDERHIEPLLRSALYQRRAVELTCPVIAIQYTTAAPTIYLILVAWLEYSSTSGDVALMSYPCRLALSLRRPCLS